MADTPLELYEEAYRLHYHDKKIPEAVRMYETISRIRTNAGMRLFSFRK